MLRFLGLFLLCALASPAWGSDNLAMQGTPKYGAAWTHFDYTNPDAPKKGKLVLGVVGTFDSLNPFIVRGTPPVGPGFGFDRTGAVYEPLMARSWDEPFSLYPLIAQHVETPDDRSSVTFDLNPAARWQDGVPVTADDVLFSFETLRKEGRPNHRTYYGKVARAEKLGPLRVRFTFTPQGPGVYDRELPLIMGLMPVLPRHDWQDRPFNATTLRPPVGSGPYKVVAVVPGRSITLQRNPAYWGRDLPAQRGMYNFNEVRLDYYRDDSIALQAFKAGAFDVRRETDPMKWATGYETEALRDGQLTLLRLVHQRTEPAYGFVLNLRRPVFQNAALRQAVGLAFDFGWIDKTLFRGLFLRSESFFPNSDLATAARQPPKEAERAALLAAGIAPDDARLTKGLSLPESDGSAVSQRRNLERAAQILREAGYLLRGDKLFSPKGEAVGFEIVLRDPAEEKIALNWARLLVRLGIEAKVRVLDSAQYQMRLSTFDYDVTSARWFNSLSPGNEQAYYWSCAAAGQMGSRNYPGFCDPAIDALTKILPQTRTRTELVATTKALDRLLLAQRAVILFGHLGADLVALWPARVAFPAGVPLYGPVLESFYAP